MTTVLPAHRTTLGVVCCLGSAAGFGLGPIFAKGAYALGATVPVALAGRFTMAAALLWLLVLLRARRTGRRPTLGPSRVLLTVVGLGAVGYAAQAAFYYGSLTRVDASLAALLVYVYPGLVVLLALFLGRERPTRRRLTALACSALGLVLLLGSAGTGPVDGPGVLLVLGAAVCYSLYLTVTAGLPPDLDPVLVAAVITTAAAGTLITLGAASGTLHAPRPSAWLWLLGLAVVATVVPIAALYVGIRSLGAPTAAILSCVEPAVAVLSAAVFYGERLTPVQFLGGAIVLTAVAVLQLRRRRPPSAASAPAPELVPVGECRGRESRSDGHATDRAPSGR
ncbi:MAG TPA: DMT family transporter [Pseudonocardiaceae bacterium]